MKICLITRTIDKNIGQGIDNVNYNLIKQLKKKGINPRFLSSKKRLKSSINGIFYDFSLFYRLFKEKAEIYHATVPYVGIAPIILKKKNIVVSIHDTIPFSFSGMHPLSRKYYIICTKICKKADKIITVSEYSKQEIIKKLNINANKIEVIYNGVNHDIFFPKKKKNRKILKIGFVGGLTKQKNPINLIKAFSNIENKDCLKLLIGGAGKEFKTLNKFIKEKKVKNVEIVGFIPENQLAEFYRELDLFVFPSLFEGFGLPVLEAMACGCPVIASNVASLPEIVGNAGILIDPNNIKNIQESIEKVIRSKNLQKKMRINGIKRAKEFSWEKTAKKYVEVYKKLK